jgi:hypothetical protein
MEVLASCEVTDELRTGRLIGGHHFIGIISPFSNWWPLVILCIVSYGLPSLCWPCTARFQRFGVKPALPCILYLSSMPSWLAGGPVMERQSQCWSGQTAHEKATEIKRRRKKKNDAFTVVDAFSARSFHRLMTSKPREPHTTVPRWQVPAAFYRTGRTAYACLAVIGRRRKPTGARSRRREGVGC